MLIGKGLVKFSNWKEIWSLMPNVTENNPKKKKKKKQKTQCPKKYLKKYKPDPGLVSYGVPLLVIPKPNHCTFFDNIYV